jgi:hypothetical protein
VHVLDRPRLGSPDTCLHQILREVGVATSRSQREVHDLGADTPAASFPVAASRVDRLVAVTVGVTTPGLDRTTPRRCAG